MIEHREIERVSLIGTAFIQGEAASMIEGKFSYGESLRTELFSLVL